MERVWLVTCGVLALVACSRGPAESEVPAGPAVLNDSNIDALVADGGTASAQASRALGEDCGVSGRAACRSGVCLKAAIERGRGFYCSRECSDQRDCPLNWSCRQVMPGPHGVLCIPPDNWTARAVGVRP